MAVQPAVVFGIGLVFYRYCDKGDFCPGPSNKPDENRTFNCLDFSYCIVFCQLGVCHFICPLNFASIATVEIAYIYRSLYLIDAFKKYNKEVVCYVNRFYSFMNNGL